MNGQVAVVTGGSRGIGRAIALYLSQGGYKVAINYLPDEKNLELAETVVREIEACGGVAMTVGADVSKSDEAQAMIEQTVQNFGQIDVLVNNAGINKDQVMMRISDEDWDKILRTNLNSVFYCSRAALRHMVRKRYGRIINVSSVVGLAGNAGQAHYAASKSGIIGLTYSIGREYGGRGITANVIAPGYIKSDMTASLSPEQIARLQDGVALRRLGTPEDVAGVAVFLASPQAAYVTCQTICVDGGMAL